MRQITLRILPVLLLVVCGLAKAGPITYGLSFTSGSNQVTGSITTDGTLGSIGAANITDWAFTDSGAYSFSIDSFLTDASLICQGSSTTCGLTATTNTLEFDFTNTGNVLAFCGYGACGRPSLEFAALQLFVNGPVGYFGTGQADGNFVEYCNPCSSSVIATVVPNQGVPIPATFALFGLGLVGLGWSRRKKA